jgi:hypothetical protein
MNLTMIRSAIPDLETQCQRAIDAAESFRDACKAVAKRHDIDPPVLAVYVRALVRDKLAEYERRHGQMEMLLEVSTSFAAQVITESAGGLIDDEPDDEPDMAPAVSLAADPLGSDDALLRRAGVRRVTLAD